MQSHENPIDIEISEVRAAIGDAPETDPGLRAVILAWPKSDDAQRRTILAIVRGV